MTDRDRETPEERLRRASSYPGTWATVARTDLRSLLEENERLRAEVEILQLALDEALRRVNSIDAALAARKRNLEATCPCIIDEEPNCTHGEEHDPVCKALKV